MILIKKDKVKTIAKCLYDHFNGSTSINKSKNERKFDEGYMINKKILDELEEKILYHDYLPHSKEYENKINEKYRDMNKKDKIQINSYEKIKFTTYREMLNNLREKNEYVILNYTVFTSIKSENLNEKIIEYEINNNQLIIKLNDIETVYFNYNSYIINESSLIKVENLNKKKIDQTFECIKKYYEFKQLLKKELNKEQLTTKYGMTSSQISVEKMKKEEQKNLQRSMNNIKVQNLYEIKVGFLIKNETFKEWEKYTDYEKIKNKNILSEKQEEIEEIKEYIIFIRFDIYL